MQIVPYSVACAALAQAKSVDDVKDIADKAEAMRVYAKRAKNRDLELDAAEIRIRAERRLGEMLADLKRVGVLSNGGQPLQSRGQPPLDGSRVTLRALGVDHKLSMKAQHLARIEPDRFETQLHDLRVRSREERGERPLRFGPQAIATITRRMSFASMAAGLALLLWVRSMDWSPASPRNRCCCARSKSIAGQPTA